MNNAFTRIVFFDEKNMSGEDMAFDDPMKRRESAAVTRSIPAVYDFSVLYPFDSSSASSYVENTEKSLTDTYKEKVNVTLGKLDDYSSIHLPGYDSLMALYNEYDRLLGWEVKNPNDLVYLENGHLAYYQEALSSEELDGIANSVADFDSFLNSMDIPFIYVNICSKTDPDDNRLSLSLLDKENTNYNADGLLARLNDANVSTMDFRQEIKKAGLDWYNCFYITDHHWTTDSGLFAAKTIAGRLNAEAGFDFDENIFSPDSYDIETIPGCFLGSLGRIDKMKNCSPEDYNCILPKFETSFDIEIPSQGIAYTGDFKNTLCDYGLLKEVRNYSGDDHFVKADAYHSVLIRNVPLSIIKNLNPRNNEGKKLLIIQDSFSWYSTPFLSCDISEIHIIHAQEFNGSIRAYIKELRPDAVIMATGEFNIKAIDYSTHTSQFDLR